MSIPYKVAKAMREAEPTLQAHTAALSELIGRPCRFVIDYAALSPALVEARYDPDQFGQIFYESYPENIVNRIRSLIEGDSFIKEPIAEKMTEGTVTFRFAKETDWCYHRCLFENGGLVIEIGEGHIWANIGDIGQDIPDRL
jgi:hypothetical protein